ncbi:hypothetical protein ACEWY4_013936 [Coilia grayii]|uniref:Gypsy retrotransposon integrase-like protein 1 n=1 Tax=Coilia grayii TaxID=363190 RepID=A0ABD1JXV0_9TELE
MRLMRFNVKAVHVPGKQLIIADTLSRNPLNVSEATDTDEDVKAYGYHTARAHLSEADGLLLYDDRIVIPGPQRMEVLSKLHEGHFSLTKSGERAKMSVWWPGIGTDITRRETVPSRSRLLFSELKNAYDFQHTTSSPHYLQANGAVEQAVQTAKRILRQPDPHVAWMNYRATPIQSTGQSPAQLAVGRQIRTRVPTLTKHLQPRNVSLKQLKAKDGQTKQAYRFFYNRRHSARDLPALHPGQHVKVKLDGEKRWTTPGVIISNAPEPRSYIVKTEQGTVTRRNRHHLQLVPEQPCLERQTPPEDDAQPAGVTTSEPAQPASSPKAPDQASQQGLPVQLPSTPVPMVKRSSGRTIKTPVKFKDFVR